MSSPPTSGSEPPEAAGDGAPPASGDARPGHRCGYVAFVGRPNAGKSTLFNAFLGQRLSIVTPRPQTTRSRILGVLTRPGSQLVLLDTPGLLESRYRLQEVMARQIERACSDADVLVLLLDGTRPDDRADLVRAFLERNRKPLLPVLNKVDLLDTGGVDTALARVGQLYGLEGLLPLSALAGTNVPVLLQRLENLAPVGPPLYPQDMIAEQPERFFSAELIRETAFEQLVDELPYSIQVEIDEFSEPVGARAGRKTYLHATIYVERESQKGIVIGHRGARLKSIGAQARGKLEELVGGPVFLELRVRVRPGWRSRERDLRDFGYE